MKPGEGPEYPGVVEVKRSSFGGVCFRGPPRSQHLHIFGIRVWWVEIPRPLVESREAA